MKQYLLSLCAVMLICLPGCFGSDTPVPKKSGVVMVNVLGKALYDDCHVKGSINIPMEDEKAFIERCEAEIAKDATVIFYCSNYMCSASGYAQQLLSEKGYKTYAYEGGTAEWYQAKRAVEGVCKQGYLTRPNAPPVAQEGDQVHAGVISMDELERLMSAQDAAESA